MVKQILLNQVRHVIRLKHYSIRTEEAYINWVKRYILFPRYQRPKRPCDHAASLSKNRSRNTWKGLKPFMKGI